MRQLLAALILLALSLPALAHSGPDHDHDPGASASASPAETTPRQREFRGKGQPPHAPLSAYKEDQVLGWKLLVEDKLLADEQLYAKVKAEVHHELYLIEQTLPQDKVQWLKTVPIWIDLDNPWHDSAQYHPSKDWISENGYLPEKAQCVEISNAKNYLRRWTHHKANTLLHELAHAYHHQKLSFEHKGIEAVYDKVMAAGIYDKVLMVGGREVRHYAATDHKEYFAECTEAFFGCNDYYPFVRSELKKHDPDAYRMVVEMWGVER